MLVTLRDYLKQYQNRLRNPAMARSPHAGTIEAVPLQTQEQPMSGIVINPMLSQARAEEAFYTEQLSSGYQIMQSGILETAADEINMRLYQAHNNYFGAPERVAEQVEPPPEMQQPTEAQEPMPHPWTFGLGGW